MRMIDADVLLTRLSDWRDSETPKAGDLPHIKQRQELVCRIIEKAMDAAETLAEARETAHWKFGEGWDGNSIKCSACGAQFLDIGELWDYCPKCGAKMWEDEDERSKGTDR